MAKGKRESCYSCVYSYRDWFQVMSAFTGGFPSRPACANHPDSFGRMRTAPSGLMCRNYRPKPATPGGEARQIPLGDGYYAYVDAADYEWLSQWKWRFHAGYAVRRTKTELIYMHREIMKPPKGMMVDHKNRNKLDNTRENLRNATRQENLQNTGKRPGTSSRFKGVSYRKDLDKWCAKLEWRGERFSLGYFAEEIEAARAYDRKAVELFGEFAWVNLPAEWPPDRRAEVCAQRDAAKAKDKKVRGSEGKRQKAKSKKTETGRRRTRVRRQRTAEARNRRSRAETLGRRDQDHRTQRARRKTN